MERAQVDVHSVTIRIDGGYLYARITAFSDTTAEDFAASIARIRRDMGREAARSHPRPAQQSGWRARVGRRSRGPAARDRRHRDRRRPHAGRALHDGGHSGRCTARRARGGAGERLDASAAEILAGALQDHHRARVARPAHFRQGLGADRDAAQRGAPSSSPRRATSRRRAARSRATASIPTTCSRTSMACRSISTTRACVRRSRARRGHPRGARAAQGAQTQSAPPRHDRERRRAPWK